MIGNFNTEPKINLEEVEAWKWMSPELVKKDIHDNPTEYTVWFKIIFEKFYQHLFNTTENYES